MMTWQELAYYRGKWFVTREIDREPTFWEKVATTLAWGRWRLKKSDVEIIRDRTRYLIVETDNHGGDYPDEEFVNVPPFRSKKTAQKVADAINEEHCPYNSSRRFWRVVKEGYELSPGFTP